MAAAIAGQAAATLDPPPVCHDAASEVDAALAALGERHPYMPVLVREGAALGAVGEPAADLLEHAAPEHRCAPVVGVRDSVRVDAVGDGANDLLHAELRVVAPTDGCSGIGVETVGH